MKNVFLFLLSLSSLQAQINLDSLLRVNPSLPETSQVDILINNCWLMRNKNPQLAKKYGEEAISKAKKSNKKNLQAKAMNILGVVYRNLGEHEKALDLFNDALNIAIETKDSIQMAYSYNNVGGIYRLQGNNSLALEYVYRGLEIFEKFNHAEGKAFCSINIGLIYKNQENFDQALEHFMNVLQLRRKTKDEPGIALTLILIGETYIAKEDINNALKFYLLAEAKYKKLNDLRGLASAWGGIGKVYELKGEYEKAINYHTRALNYSRELNYLDGQVMNLNRLAIIHAKLNKLKEAEEFLKQAKSLAKYLSAAYLVLDCYNQWINYYEIINDYKNAFYYSKKIDTVKDSLISKQNVSVIKTMESIYKAEKSEREKAILQKDKELAEKQRDYFILITLLILLIAVITYSRYITKKIANEKLKKLNLMKDTLFRIIAHDLRNPFSIMFGYINLLKDNYDTLNDEEKLTFITNMGKAAKQNLHLLENLLLWSRLQTGKLEVNMRVLDLYEIIIENFLALSELAKDKNINLETSINDELKVKADENMLNFILKNLIHNGIKYTHKGGKVYVSAEKMDKFVKINIEDNGTGLDELTKSKLFEYDLNKRKNGTEGEGGSGLGLIICKEFIEKLGGNLYVFSELNKGTKFSFTLPSAN
ncbi:tetratricopeptide repeat-containing sensor histidine kinase [Rosettibacter firmus]|uniref:tetratricopeptide repeat-containing sensor histidine kinase n=1 Tax=Rosettibacter firmus TaxID=3111522 RepID=UPI00336BB127